MNLSASEHWYLLQSGCCGYSFNMALDEALMELAPIIGAPVLRFYAWRESAASFGYFQKISEIERTTRLRPLVRRPTGGGLVPHEADWTYSVAVPAGHPWYELRAEQSYERVHRWVQGAFTKLQVATQLAPGSLKDAPGQCFIGYEKYDVLQGGRKIAGAAQRRTKTGLLIQGSVQPQPRGITRAAWENAMCNHASSVWQVIWKVMEAAGPWQVRAKELEDSRYSQEAYNRRR